MATLHTLRTPASLPVALLSQAIHRLSRHELEDLAQSLIDHIDAIDGDPDLEDDDPAGQCDEDGINTDHRQIASALSSLAGGAGEYEDWGLGAGYGVDQTQPLYNPSLPMFEPVVDLLPSTPR